MVDTMPTTPHSSTRANTQIKGTAIQRSFKVVILEFETFIYLLERMDKGRLFDLQLNILLIALSQEFVAHDHLHEWKRDKRLHRTALRLYRRGSSLFSSMLYNLGSIIVSRHLHLGESAEANEVDEAISVLPEILSFPVLNVTKRLGTTLVLARCLKARFSRLKDLSDLDGAVRYFRIALQICPPSEDHQRALAHLDLALLLQHYHKDAQNLEPILDNLRQCHRLLPPGNPNRVKAAVLLYTFLHIRFFKFDDETVIEESAQLQIEVVSSYPPRHPERLKLLLDCGGYLFVYFTRRHTPSHLDLSYDYFNEALTLTPPDQINERVEVLTAIVSVCNARFEETGKMADLEHGIKCARRALELCPPGSPLRSTSLSAISGALLLRHSKLGGLQDLQEAVTYSRANKDLQPSEGSDPLPLINLAWSLYGRTSPQSGGDNNEIDEAIGWAREAVNIARLSAHVSLPRAIAALTHGLVQRFQDIGDMTDIDEAITLLRAKVNEITKPAKNDTASLANLSGALTLRYRALRDIGDLKESDQMLRKTLHLVDPTHPNYPAILSALANQRQALVSTKRDRDIDLLDSTLELHREALRLCPSSDPNLQVHLCNLGWVLLCRFGWLKKVKDLNEAIKHLREAVNFPDPSVGLYILGGALIERAGLHNSPSRLQEAIDTLHHAESLAPEGHPTQGRVAHVLGQAYESRYELFGEADDMDKAIHYFENASNQASGGLGDQLSVTTHWALKSHTMRHKSSLRAYSTYLFQLERLATLSNTIERHHALLAETYQFMPSLAASCAIDEGQVETAIEFLEQGRAIIWAQVGRYRSSLDRLDEVNPTLAKEFHTLSLQLENSVVAPSDISNRDATAYRLQSSRWSALLEDIRAHNGFSNFLKPTPFVDLQKAALNGPVVIVNIDGQRSKAIIIQHASSPISINLPGATEVIISQLSTNLTSALALDHDDVSIERSARVVSVLRSLWDVIACPVVEELRSTCGLPLGSRVWWCPTSSLWTLPLHAAGPYRAGERNLPDIFVSSYTSTLSALLRSSNRWAINKVRTPSMLVVGQVQTPGRAPLVNVVEEIQQVQEFVPSVSILEGEHATCDAVTAGLQEFPWVHFACHGKQDFVRPFNSHFILHDKPLHLLDIIQKGLPNAEFAFLSACHSAAGDKTIPNESIHLASALQFSGFGGVVGTMWSMVDDDGPVVAKEFYKVMFQDPGVPDFRNAAVALNRATKVLRRMGVPVERWINFVHIGA